MNTTFACMAFKLCGISRADYSCSRFVQQAELQSSSCMRAISILRTLFEEGAIYEFPRNRVNIAWAGRCDIPATLAVDFSVMFHVVRQLDKRNILHSAEAG